MFCDLAAASADGQIDEYDKPILGKLMTLQVTEFKNAHFANYRPQAAGVML